MKVEAASACANQLLKASPRLHVEVRACQPYFHGAATQTQPRDRNSLHSSLSAVPKVVLLQIQRGCKGVQFCHYLCRRHGAFETLHTCVFVDAAERMNTEHQSVWMCRILELILGVAKRM